MEAEEESDSEFDDNPESKPQQSTSQPWSTSQPLPKKQKVESKKSKEEFLLDQAALVFQARKRVEDGDDIFGKNIAFSLRQMKNKRIKEYKVKNTRSFLWCSVSARRTSKVERISYSPCSK